MKSKQDSELTTSPYIQQNVVSPNATFIVYARGLSYFLRIKLIFELTDIDFV
jgi:outer membrane protein assembly factor BamD (BamD/ComL family)